MTIKYHDVVQGEPEWFAARCGLITASEMSLILTPTLKVADNAAVRTHLWELLAQRVNHYVEPGFQSFDMVRGHEDEVLARERYSTEYAPVREVGFVTNDRWGFTLGYSPDGLVGDEGLIECKSRRQKYQMQTIVEYGENSIVPQEYQLQLQTALLVTERAWVDLISYCGGMPMCTMRVTADTVVQDAIIAAAAGFEQKLAEKHDAWARALIAPGARLVLTERREFSDGDDIVAEMEE